MSEFLRVTQEVEKLPHLIRKELVIDVRAQARFVGKKTFGETKTTLRYRTQSTAFDAGIQEVLILETVDEIAKLLDEGDA